MASEWIYKSPDLTYEVDARTKMKDLENTAYLLSQENDRIKIQLQEKKNEIEQWRARVNQQKMDYEKAVELSRTELQNKLRFELESQAKEISNRHINERNNLENQLRQMKIQINELENQTTNSQREIAKLNSDIRDKNSEIESWRSRYESLERNHQLKLKEINDRIERQKKSEIDEITRKTSSQFTLDKTSMESQIGTLQKRLEESENSNKSYKTEIQKLVQSNFDKIVETDQLISKLSTVTRNCESALENLRMQSEIDGRNKTEASLREQTMKFDRERQEYESQIKLMRSKLIEAENRTSFLNSKEERWNNLINEKDREIDLIKNDLQAFKKLKENEIKDIIQNSESERMNFAEQRVKDLNIQFARERASYETRSKELKQKITDYETKIAQMTLEIGRLHNTAEERLKEIESFKSQYQKFDKIRNEEYEELKIQYENLKRSTLRMSDYEIRFQAERSAYETEIMQLKHQVNEYEIQLKESKTENYKLLNSNHEKQLELDALKVKLTFKENSNLSEELAALRRDYDNLKAKTLAANENELRYDVERQKYENQIQQLKQNIDFQKDEISKLYKLLQDRKLENQGLFNKLNEVREEDGNKAKIYQELESKYYVLNSRYEQSTKEIIELQKTRDIYKSQLEKVNLDVTRKNKELQDRIKEIDNLRNRYEDIISKYDPNSSKVNRASFKDSL